MDGLGVQVERRPAPDPVPVERLAVRRRQEPGPLAGRLVVRAPKRLEQPPVGRVDDLAHDVPDPLAFRVAGHLGHRRDDRLLDGDGQDALELLDRPVRDDARGRPPRAQAVGHDVEVGVHERPVAADPRQEGVEALGRVRRLELGQLGEQRLRPRHLVDDLDLAIGQVVRLDRDLGHDLQHVARDPVLDRQALRRDRGGLAPDALHQPPLRGAPLGPGVVQAVVVALVAVDRGGQRRQPQHVLPVAGGDLVDLGGLAGRVRHARELLWWCGGPTGNAAPSLPGPDPPSAAVSRRTARAGRRSARSRGRGRGCPPCRPAPPLRATPSRGGDWP